MKILLLASAVILFFSSCEKSRDNSDDSDSVNHTLLGRYVGTFNRSGMDTAPVSIFFKDRGRYEGSSSRQKYPAICRGSFLAHETSITFSDSCTWTADFDWTLILNGTYNITYKDDDHIRIYRTNGTITDEYIVAKVN